MQYRLDYCVRYVGPRFYIKLYFYHFEHENEDFLCG